jgi:CRP-like cAMP-binding protein
MDEPPDKLSNGEPLSTEDLISYLPALKEVPSALLRQFASGAAVRRRFREGDIVCREGEFGSTAFFLVSGQVDIYIQNPLAHVKTSPGAGLLSLFKRMRSSLASDKGTAQATEERGFIPIDASVDLPRTTPLARLGPGELFGEMTCRTFQPRSATVRATEPCVMVEMLRVILDMLVGTRSIDAETKASTKVKAPTRSSSTRSIESGHSSAICAACRFSPRWIWSSSITSRTTPSSSPATKARSSASKATRPTLFT